jgi:hypothetical protein
MTLMQRRTAGSRLGWTPQDGEQSFEEARGQTRCIRLDDDGKEKEMKKKDGMKFGERMSEAKSFSSSQITLWSVNWEGATLFVFATGRRWGCSCSCPVSQLRQCC